MSKGGVIYEPKGRALEYSPLACNLYTGCMHGCKYCYAPAALRKKQEEFNKVVQPRKDILARLEVDCIKMRGDKRQVLLCFHCDPYPNNNAFVGITTEALLILEKYEMNVSVLTKGGLQAVRNFDILQRNGWQFGTTLSYNDDVLRKAWEPDAASVDSRVHAIELASSRGIFTWVSVEPVIDAPTALAIMDRLLPLVDQWRVGKLNHYPKIEAMTDWPAFLKATEEKLQGKVVHFKHDLLKAAGRI